MADLARLAGAVALALLLLQFLTSGRLERLSGRFGIDATMRLHQLAARAVLLLALLHPLAFALPGSPREAMDALAMLFALEPMRSGVAALAALALLVAAAIARKRLPLPYEAWRGSHVLLALLAAGGALHHAFTVGTASGTGAPAVLWALLAAAAFATLAWSWLLKPFLLARRAWVVTQNEARGEGIRELVLEPANGAAMAYRAGQFVWVDFGRVPFTLRDHPFSLASSPREGPALRLLIRDRGDFSGAVESIAPGCRAFVDGPHGNFTHEGRGGQSILLVAGGIGIAPILGILRDLAAAGDPRPVSLVYGARDQARLAGREVIAAAAGRLSLRVTWVLEDPPAGWAGATGAITEAVIAGAMQGFDPAGTLALSCGPTPMMLSVARQLRALGVPAGKIVYERFEYDE